MIFDEINQALTVASDKVHTLHQQLEAFFTALPDPFFILDESGLFLEVLGGNERSLYNSLDFLKGLNVKDVLSERLATKVMDAVSECFESQHIVLVEYQLEPSDIVGNPYKVTQTRWYEGRVSPVKNSAGDVIAVIWLVINITEKKALELQLQQMADTDPLTGAFNRRFINNAFQKEFAYYQRYKTPLSCVLLDIDFFKKINDRYGHDVGDAVLVQLTSILSESIRASDVFARYGGEEFVVLLPNTELDDATHVAELLRSKIEQTALVIDDHTVRYTISAGVSSALPDDVTYASVVTRADKTLYQSKRMGRNRVSESY